MHTQADRVVKSICPYCAVGCAQNVYVKDGRVVQIEGATRTPPSAAAALGIVQVENQARVCHSSTVAALGTSFGRGGATMFPGDLVNSDCIVIQGSNMAEGDPRRPALQPHERDGAGRRSRPAAAASGAALLAASACTRFAIFRAGMASARDPRHTVLPQREHRAH